MNILAIIPYENIYPPMNGGMLRCFHLLRQLCIHFEITVIIHQDSRDFCHAIQHYPELKKCKVFSTKDAVHGKDFFSLLPGTLANAARFRYWKRSLEGPADGNFLRYYPTLVKLLKSSKYDCVLLENLGTLHAVPVIKRYQSSFILYDAHNVDSSLASKSALGESYSEKEFRVTRELESSLNKHVDGVITCSQQDLDTLRSMNKESFSGVVIPNGVEVHTVKENERGHRDPNKIIFCGSLDYEPNRQGLLWFCSKVLPRLLSQVVSLSLIVVGKGDPGEELSNALKTDGVIYYGEVIDVKEYYAQASVAIVPLLTGSGTRLKILEAMSLGLPVISTSKGAEGIDHTAGENICIADEEILFGEMVIQLLNRKDLAAEMASKAYCLVKRKYDWNLIGPQLASFLTENVN